MLIMAVFCLDLVTEVQFVLLSFKYTVSITNVT